MFARLLALFAALSVSAAVGDPQTTIAVYLKPGAADAATLEYMKRELAVLMQSAGFVLEWPDADRIPQTGDAQLVVLELDGACSAPADAGPSEAGLQSDQLASTAASDGKILPFANLRCENLNRLVADRLAVEPPARRNQLYARAMARLAAHELYHVVADSGDHSREGVAKARLTTSDLLSDGLEFSPEAIGKMHRAIAAGIPSAAPPASISESSGQK